MMRANLLRRAIPTLRASQLRYSTSISDKEKSHFNALASTWWDVNGPQRILHKMNLLRMDFIVNTIRNGLKLNEGVTVEEEVYVPPYSVDLLPSAIKYRINEDIELRRDEILSDNKLSVLDVGCGGGILSESLARLNFIDKVTAIDLSNDVIQAAKLHQKKDPMLTKLEYKLVSLDLLDDSKFDIITMFEMLEHVEYPAKVLSEGLKRLQPGGWLFVSTINRDFVSWFTTIFMAEHVLGIVPKGTHTLNKYINQKEISDWIDTSQYKVVDAKGCMYIPSYGWKFTGEPNVGNFFMAIKKSEQSLSAAK